MVATDRDSDGTPKEHFDDHAAGLGGLAGHGGSSYIDSVIWRDKDANTAWNSAADSTMEQRHDYCQNWRADVSAVVNDDGSRQIESIKYFSYGYPVNIPAGDVNSDGVTDSSDTTEINKWRLDVPVVYRVRADLNLDGVLDASDETLCSQLETTVGGRGVLSRSDTGNRKGYAGYESDATADAGGSRFWHVRHRVLDSTLGRWTRRDPLGYVDGFNLERYLSVSPTVGQDPSGLIQIICRRGMADLTIKSRNTSFRTENCTGAPATEKYWSRVIVNSDFLESACRQAALRNNMLIDCPEHMYCETHAPSYEVEIQFSGRGTFGVNTQPKCRVHIAIEIHCKFISRDGICRRL